MAEVTALRHDGAIIASVFLKLGNKPSHCMERQIVNTRIPESFPNMYTFGKMAKHINVDEKEQIK